MCEGHVPEVPTSVYDVYGRKTRRVRQTSPVLNLSSVKLGADETLACKDGTSELYLMTTELSDYQDMKPGSRSQTLELFATRVFLFTSEWNSKLGMHYFVAEKSNFLLTPSRHSAPSNKRQKY